MNPCERSVYFSKFMFCPLSSAPLKRARGRRCVSNHTRPIWVLASMTKEGQLLIPAGNQPGCRGAALVFRLVRGVVRGHIPLGPAILILPIVAAIALSVMAVARRTVAALAVAGLALNRRGGSVLHRAVLDVCALAIVVGLAILSRLPIIAHRRAGAVTIGIDRAVVVFSVLEVVLHGHPVAGQAGIARQGQILLHHLIGVAPHPDILARTIEILRARGIVRVMRIVRLTRATPARPAGIRTLSHARSHCSYRDPRFPNLSCVPGWGRTTDRPEGFMRGLTSSPLDQMPRRRVLSEST